MTTREDILSLAGSTFRLDENRPALLIIEKPDGSCIEIKPGAHATYGEALALCRLLRDGLIQALAAPTPPAAEAPGQAPVAVKGVDSQVMVAATQLDDDQKRNPRWLWYGDEARDVSLGRWQRYPSQAPYVRADLVSAPPTYADAEAKGWQTMDSAPLDGSRVDLWLDWPAHDDKPARQERSPDAFYDRITGDWVLLNHWFLGQYAAKPMATHWRRSQAGPAAIRSLASPAPKGET